MNEPYYLYMSVSPAADKLMIIVSGHQYTLSKNYTKKRVIMQIFKKWKSIGLEVRD